MKSIIVNDIAKKHNVEYTDDVNNYTIELINTIGIESAFLTDDEKINELKQAREHIEWLEKRNQEICEDYSLLKQSNLEVHREYNNLKEKYGIESLRDKFAGLAMQPLINIYENTGNEKYCAKFAYQQADAMLKERRK